MCGITGYFTNSPSINTSIIKMAESIQHRGPDDGGYVMSEVNCQTAHSFSSRYSPAIIKERWPTLVESGDVPAHHVAMAQVRYSIIDLSPAGHQPMWSACGEYCLTFNGEIYNYIELRAELIKLGCQFLTNSDTEVLLQGYMYWGVGVFNRLNGFFAIALFDRKCKAILIGRDRLGKSHLYLNQKVGQAIHWASEIKALIVAGCIYHDNIDVSAVADFVLYNRRDQWGTFWKDVIDFPPGHYAWINANCQFEPVQYWSLPTQRLSKKEISLEQASSGLCDLLTNALDIRLRADVPIAFELSGGLDSSALVGLAAGRLGKNIQTYTVEFQEEGCNEEPYARAVSLHYPNQINYNVIQSGQDEFWKGANDFCWQQEEPFHAPNLYTSQCMQQLIKSRGAHVVISGAAGDEMLAGYAGYYLVPYLRHLLNAGSLSEFIHELRANTEVNTLRSLRSLTLDLFLNDKSKTNILLRKSGQYALLKDILSPSLFASALQISNLSEERSFHGMTTANMSNRLMNYWLRSGGKSAYAIPIEVRMPFLDYRVTEFCMKLPPEYLIHDGWHKYVLRKAVENYLPTEVTWRRTKMGFPFPYREWLIQSQVIATENMKDVNCPWINIRALIKNYDALVHVCPVTLWRLISVVLWWRRIIEQRAIMSEA